MQSNRHLPGEPIRIAGQLRIGVARRRPGGSGRRRTRKRGAAVAVIGSGRIDARIDGSIDGRRARSVRTREAVMDALVDLVAKGDIAPTAQRIADSAGVSVRSVYQHFIDVEGLYADAAGRMFSALRARSSEMDLTQPFARRADSFADARAAILEQIVPFHRALRLVEATSERVRAERAEMVRWERERVASAFAPELRRAPRGRRSQLLAALDALTSPEMWDHLRRSGQSVRSARQIMRDAIACVLGVH